MPLRKCKIGGKPGWKWGQKGTCYKYTSGNRDSQNKARQKAINQGIASGDINTSSKKELLLKLKPALTKSIESELRGGDTKMKDKDKKDTPLSKEEQELVNLVTTSVSSKMADTISDLVTKSLDIPDDDDNKDDDNKDDDNKDDGKDKKDKADPAVNKQMDAILKGINYLITKDIKATKAAEAKTKKEAIEKTFQDAISAAVSKTLKEVGKISGGSKKKSKVNTKHQDDDDDDGDNSSLNPYTIDERTFKALTEAEQDEMVGECFKQQMGINALGELQKAAKQINRGTFNKDDDDE